MEKWLKILEDSLNDAIEKAELAEIEMQNLYMLAPILFSEKFDIKNKAKIQEMINVNDAQVAEDYSYDDESKYQYKFHYVSSYLRCFVVTDKLTEMNFDRVMDYACGEMDLFTEDNFGDE
jgi:hypothetical protein